MFRCVIVLGNWVTCNGKKKERAKEDWTFKLIWSYFYVEWTLNWVFSFTAVEWLVSRWLITSKVCPILKQLSSTYIMLIHFTSLDKSWTSSFFFWFWELTHSAWSAFCKFLWMKLFFCKESSLSFLNLLD